MTTLRVIQYLIIVNAVVIIAQSVRVIAVYSSYYSMMKKSNPQRQLPLHVWLIATSFLMYVLGTTTYLAIRGTDYGWPRSIWYGLAGLLGQYALFQVLHYERRQYNNVTLKKH